MKKLMILGLLAFMVSLVVGCSSCTKEKSQPAVDNVALAQGKLVVENCVSTDKEYMFLHHKSDYRWFETCVLMKDFLDSEDQDGTIAGVTNIFQVVDDFEDGSADVHVYLIAHSVGKDSIDVRHGFWVEDFPMNNEAIKITFQQAYDKLMEANCPKPHSRHCVLRKEIGPVDANPQYIFGNSRAQVYVDAVTGDVSTENPAFNGSGFGMPLGEWP